MIVQGNSDHAISVAKEFMATNKIYAHKNFGKHADNMCALVCQISKEKKVWISMKNKFLDRFWYNIMYIVFKKVRRIIIFLLKMMISSIMF